jgi:NitT/TauT family transport system substrate-binding protein
MKLLNARLWRLAAVILLIGLVAAGCAATGAPALTADIDQSESEVGEGTAEAQGVESTAEPTAEPTAEATAEAHGAESTAEPTAEPTAEATAAPTATPMSAAPGQEVSVTLFLGYIPNIQFAPVYVALARGYFREEGIDLSLEHGFDETDGLARIATDNLKFGLVSGEQVILARAQNAPVVYVYRWYQRYPVGVVSERAAGLTEPAQLAGKVIGVPGKFGASYIGLQALLNSAGLAESDLREVRAIGFDTAPVVCDRQVEASVVYVANEPAQIAARCFEVNVIEVADYANLISNGMVTNEKTIAEQPELVRGMVRAFHRGLEATIADPEAAYAESRQFVEGLAESDALQMGVLMRSIDIWRGERLGANDVAAWQLTADTLLAMGLLRESADLEGAYTDTFVP